MNLQTIKGVKQIFFTLIGLIVVAGLMLVAYPLFTQSQKFSQEISIAKSEESSALEKLTVLEGYKKTLPDVEKLDTAMLAQFPAAADTPGLVSIVSAAASESGMSVGNIQSLTTGIPTLVAASQDAAAGANGAATTPAAPAAAPIPGQTGGLSNVAEMTVEISAKGNATQLNSFVEKLNNAPRNLLISSYAISSDKTSGESTLTVSGKSYIYKAISKVGDVPVAPEGNVDSAVPSTEPTTPAS